MFCLLLHCDDISDLDEDMLLDNPKVRAKRRYTEQKLREKMPKYRKSVYDTNWFIERINTAIKNDTGLRHGVYVYNGVLTKRVIADRYGLVSRDIDLLMAAF